MLKRPEKKKTYRALITLVYSDLGGPERVGKLLCKAGETTQLYDELLAYPDLVQRELIDKGFIEEVPDPIVRPLGNESPAAPPAVSTDNQSTVEENTDNG